MVLPPVDFPAYPLVEAHVLAGIAHLDLGIEMLAAAAAEAALAVAERDRLIFPFAETDAAELLDTLPGHETAHGALLADILDLLRGVPAPKHPTASSYRNRRSSARANSVCCDICRQT